MDGSILSVEWSCKVYAVFLYSLVTVYNIRTYSILTQLFLSVCFR
jgi:hypothetical protein